MKGDTTERLPNIFEMDNYDLCRKIQGSYCKVDFKLLPKYAHSFIWRTIQETVHHDTNYDRRFIHRLMCIPKDNENSTRLIYAENVVNKQMETYNLTSVALNVQCQKENNFSIPDYILLFCVPFYLMTILLATFYDRRKSLKRSEESLVSNNKVFVLVEQLFLAFSITSSWKAISGTRNDKDFSMLKSIQGIRFYNTILVIWFHTKITFAQSFLSNPEWLENQHFLRMTFVLDMFIVQTYFLVSAWLLANQIYGIYDSKSNFTLKDCLLIFINRMFRLVPTLIFAVLLFSSYISTSAINSPMTFDLMEITKSACLNYWWFSCFQINNLVDFHMMCHPGTWYLTIDTQYYLVALILLYLIFKFRLNYNIILAVLILLSGLIYGAVIYLNNEDIIFRMYPENLKRQNYFFSTSFRILYLSFYSSWTTSLIGTWLGLSYFKSKSKSADDDSVLKNTWVALFLLLPSFVLLVSTNEYNGIAAAVLGPVLKPLFALGIGIGIFGMSKNVSNIVKKICEWEFAVFMANFSYATHVFHVAIVFMRGSRSYELFRIGTYELFQAIVIDSTLSFLLGALVTLFLEIPLKRVQRILIPKVRSES